MAEAKDTSSCSAVTWHHEELLIVLRGYRQVLRGLQLCSGLPEYALIFTTPVLLMKGFSSR